MSLTCVTPTQVSAKGTGRQKNGKKKSRDWEMRLEVVGRGTGNVGGALWSGFAPLHSLGEQR